MRNFCLVWFTLKKLQRFLKKFYYSIKVEYIVKRSIIFHFLLKTKRITTSDDKPAGHNIKCKPYTFMHAHIEYLYKFISLICHESWGFFTFITFSFARRIEFEARSLYFHVTWHNDCLVCSFFQQRSGGGRVKTVDFDASHYPT